MAILPKTGRIFVREDWTDAGDFSGTYDDVTPYLKPSTTKVERGRDQGRVIGGVKAPLASWTLSNETLLFSTVYTGSPLYGLVDPGHLVQIGKTIGDDAIIADDLDATADDDQVLADGYVEFPILTGKSETPKERYGIGRKQVSFSAYGLMNRLVNTKISIPYQALITTGALVVMALTAAGLAADEMVVDADAIANGRELLHYYADALSCMQVLRTAWATEGPPAALYEDPYGRMVFWGRNVQLLNPETASVQYEVVDNPSSADDLYFTDIDYDSSRSSVVNDMTIEVEHKVTVASAQVWQYPSVLTLTASQTIEIFAKNTSGNLWINAITPVSPTDFTIGAGSLASLTMTTLSPNTVKITIVAGAGGATINPVGANTGFALRAQTVVLSTTEEARGTVDTSDSQDVYGKQPPPDGVLSDVWLTMSKTEADGLVDAYHIAYAAPREIATVTLEAGTGSILYAMMHAEVLQRWHIFDNVNGFDHDVFVGQISHELRNGAQQTCVLVCERVVELDWARFDVGRFDVGRFGN